MSDVDEDVLASRRRTWMLGGVLLMTSGFAWIAVEIASAPLGWLGLTTAAIAFVLFAVGLGRDGSVTARRPLGTAALVGFGVLLVAQPLVQMMLNNLPVGDGPQSAEQYAMMHQTGGIALEIVTLLLALTAVVAILRARVVPSRWRWMPIGGLIAVVIARGLAYSAQHGTMPFSMVIGILTATRLIAPLVLLVLGIAATVLALRSRRRALARVVD